MFVQVARNYSCRIRLQVLKEISRQTSCVTNVSNTSLSANKTKLFFPIKENMCRLRKYHSSALSIVSEEETDEFHKIFPDLVKELTERKHQNNFEDLISWYQRMLEYNVPHGSKRRGLSTVLSYKLLEDPQQLTPDNVRLANIIGWCVEMVYGCVLMHDDLMENAESRNGSPCWYKVGRANVSIFTDVTMLENSAFVILSTYFRDHPCYVPILELFHDVIIKTSIGRNLGYNTSSSGKPNLELFSMDRYRAIVQHKTAYYSFQFPVALAMYLAGIHDPELHRQAESVLLELGHLYHVQNDYLNCYAEEDSPGSPLYSDVRSGKCTWLAVVALQRATPAQREIMEQCYGNSEEDSIKAVLNVYEELGLPNTYSIYVEKNYNLIHTHIQQMNAKLPKKLFYNFLEMINKRMK